MCARCWAKPRVDASRESSVVCLLASRSLRAGRESHRPSTPFFFFLRGASAFSLFSRLLDFFFFFRSALTFLAASPSWCALITVLLRGGGGEGGGEVSCDMV